MVICKMCGKSIKCGCMTNGYGDWYTHEGKCFEKYMDKTYGKHKWMEIGNGEQDEYGGYYLVSAENVNGYEGTGIYYTEYTKEEIEEDE